ncbi:MAG TPA: hypothetical protein VGM19_08190 [Armatimonadota bacterium]|jgi:hypothetical protein
MPTPSAWLRLLPLLCLCLAGPTLAAEPVTVTGKVLLPDGSPAAGARVGLDAYSYGAAAWVETTAGPDGGFRLTVTPAPMTTALTLLALQSGYAPDWADVAAGDSVTLRLGDDPTTYQGRVCDAEAHPLPGADVEVTALGRLPWYGAQVARLGGSRALHAAGDDQGRFSLPDLPAGCDLTLTISAPGHARVSRFAHVSGASAPTILPPEASLSGRVLRAGQPVPGVTVRLRAVLMEPTQTVTDAQGAYRLDRIGAVNWPLTVQNLPAGWIAPSLRTPPVPPGTALTGQDFALLPAALLRGKVTDAATGQPLGGAGVYANWPAEQGQPPSGASAVTAADGTYEMWVRPGRLQASVFSAGTTPWVEVGAVKGQQLDVKEGETREGVDFALPAPPSLRGRLERPDGTPAPGLEVRVASMQRYTTATEAFVARTDAQGAWQLPFPTGGPYGRGEPQLLLAAEPASGLVAEAWVDKAQDGVPLTLAPGGYVVCSAHDPQGRPVANVMIWAQVIRAGPAVLQGRGGAASLPAVPTDAHGQARIGPLPAGDQIHLQLESDSYYEVGHAWENNAPFILAPGEEHATPTLVIDREGRTLTGTVLDERGQPAAGALVYAANGLEAAETDAAGHFTLPHVPPSPPAMLRAVPNAPQTAPPIAVLFAFDPFRPLVGEQQIAPGHEAQIQLRLAALGSATGQVVDEAGNPLPGTQVQVWNKLPLALAREATTRLHDLGMPGAPVTTDLEGKWKVEALLPGVEYRLMIFSLDGRMGQPAGQTVTSKAGEAVDLGKIVFKPPAAQPPAAPPEAVAPRPPTETGAGGPPPPA